MRRCIALLLVSLLCAGCGDDPQAQPEAQQAHAFSLDGPAALARLTDVLQRPWKRELRAHADIVSAHAVLLEESRNGFADRTRMEQLLAAPLPQVLDALSRIAPIADRIFNLEQNMNACVNALRLPPERSTPLTTRIHSHWKREREQAWKLINDGMDAVRQGQADTRLRIGIAALASAQKSAESLTAEAVHLSTAVERVRALPAELATRLQNAQRRIARWREEGRMQDAEALEASTRAVDAALPALRSRAETLALDVALESGAQQPALDELKAECDGLSRALQ